MSISRGKRPRPDALYLWETSKLQVFPLYGDVSWNERIWRFRRSRKDILIDWSDGVTPVEWKSPAWQNLIALGKRLVLAQLGGAIEKPVDLLTIAAERAALLYFLRWMLRNDYWDMTELSQQSFIYFCDDLFYEKVSSNDGDEQITNPTLSRYLNAPIRFFLLSDIFSDFPEMRLLVHPYGGASAVEVATRLIRRAVKHIPRVPVEVQNSVLPVAKRWVCDHSKDILALQEKFVDARKAIAAYSSNSYSYHTDKVLSSFQFNLSGTLNECWRAPLCAKLEVQRSIHGRSVQTCAGLTSQFKYLLTDLRDASVITLLGLAGMRISDLANFEVYPRSAEGLPYCLLKRPSATGAFELFFARGRIGKDYDETEEPDQEWLLGSRPTGSDTLPDAVKALIVLDQLFSPWRDLSNSPLLIVSLGKGKGPPRTAPAQADVQLDTLRAGQVDFVANHVELPSRYSEWVVSSHQWRKAYAEDIITINPDLIPALQQQFKHLSQTITEAAYIGNMPVLNRILAEQREYSTADAVFAIVEGGSISAGQTRADVREWTDNLSAFLREIPTTKEKKNTLRRMFAEEGITLWGQEYGDCLFRSTTARCHMIERGEIDPNARRPLAKHLCSDLCVTCSNLIISHRHRDFWMRKRDEYLRSAANAKECGETAFEVICRSRATVADRILRRLDEAGAPRDSVRSHGEI